MQQYKIEFIIFPWQTFYYLSLIFLKNVLHISKAEKKDNCFGEGGDGV
jgi:hypothetical protein